ncbi:hypothetical protein [Rouxiella chamberiensis]|uniref:hypothetical protein n=1 Tax=Rouxiella chamberiensis TaxID=1513468 RepID=UPI001F4D07C5|nr:hypothetical protein [Rouxiella chamberiensis]
MTRTGVGIPAFKETGQPEGCPARATITQTAQRIQNRCPSKGITDERIDTLIDDFFIIHGAELSSLLRMKYSQFERNGSTHAPGVIEGANDADTLYRRYVMSLIRQWTGVNQPLMFRDDVLSVSGAHPFRGARTDRRKRKLF